MTYWETVGMCLANIILGLIVLVGAFLVLALITQIGEVWAPDLMHWIKRRIFEEDDTDD